jgi:hypothetical protein
MLLMVSSHLVRSLPIYQCCGSGMFIPDPGSEMFIPDPDSKHCNLFSLGGGFVFSI